MKAGLAALIHPCSVLDFFDLYRRGQPLIVHGKHEHTQPLTELPWLQSLEVLLASWPSAIQAHLPDLRDEASSIETTARDARKLFDSGMGLLFSEAHLSSPLLRGWLETMRRDLAFPALTQGRCLVYATPDGKGTAAHFDHSANFVLQISGTKVWTLAPNSHVVNPMTRHTMGLAADPELTTYVEGPLPTSMPDTAFSVELHPGSLLFVPRGFWHSTVAHGDALSLSFTFTAPTWIDLFTAALRSRLALSAAWRETADGVSDPFSCENATRRFDDLLATLVDDLPNWRAADILEATEARIDPEGTETTRNG